MRVREAARIQPQVDGAILDRSTVDIPAGAGSTVDLLGATNLSTRQDIDLECADGGTGVTANDVRLVIMQVGDLDVK